MVLKNRYRDEFPELRATIEATPPPVRRPFKAAYPGVSVDALALMRSLDGPVPPTALRDAFDRGAWLPASVGLASVPLAALELPPTRDLIEYQTAVSCAMHADYAKHLDTLAVFADISAAWADADDTHALRMALAPVEALLKGSVA